MSDTPRVDGLITKAIEKHPGHSAYAQAIYFEDVHQDLAPLARELERDNATLRAALQTHAEEAAKLIQQRDELLTDIADLVVLLEHLASEVQPYAEGFTILWEAVNQAIDLHKLTTKETA